MNITDPLRRLAQVSPNAVAIVRQDDVSITYRELDRTIDFLARRVLDGGLFPGNAAAVAVSRPYKFLVLTLALARLGVACVPDLMPGEKVDFLFTEDPAAADRGKRAVVLDRTWWDVPSSSVNVQPVPSFQEGAAVFRIFPSSGTTGTPKFVAVSHAMIADRIFAKWLAVRLPDDARQICFVGAGTHYGFGALLRVLWVGGMLVMPTKLEQIVPFIQRYRVNALVIAPISLQGVVASLPPGFGPIPSLEAIEVAGSPLSNRLYDLARQRLCANIISVYGAVEAGAIASAPKPALYDRPGAVGYVLPGVEVQAVDDNDVPVPAGTEGVLRVRSGTCAKAYVGDAAVSANVFKGGWFYPGDVGAVSRDGLLTLGDRASDVINNGGNKVSPQVIEDVLLAMESIRDAAAFGVPDAMGVTQIWAAIVANGTVDQAALPALLRERLKEKAPTSFMQLRELPRNAAGKILRDELKKMAVAEAETKSDSHSTHSIH
jgi:acyl-coenzyme A synthetase/AMP-(fatty) acid ligase